MIWYRCHMGPKICLGGVIIKPCSKHTHPSGEEDSRKSSSSATCCDNIINKNYPSVSSSPATNEKTCSKTTTTNTNFITGLTSSATVTRDIRETTGASAASSVTITQFQFLNNQEEKSKLLFKFKFQFVKCFRRSELPLSLHKKSTGPILIQLPTLLRHRQSFHRPHYHLDCENQNENIDILNIPNIIIIIPQNTDIKSFISVVVSSVSFSLIKTEVGKKESQSVKENSSITSLNIILINIIFIINIIVIIVITNIIIIIITINTTTTITTESKSVTEGISSAIDLLSSLTPVLYSSCSPWILLAQNYSCCSNFKYKYNGWNINTKKLISNHFSINHPPPPQLCKLRTRTKQLPNSLLGLLIMSQGEGKDIWSKTRLHIDKRGSFSSVSGDEHHALNISDASQDSHFGNGNPGSSNFVNSNPVEDDGDPSPFRFLGPVGKKRRIVRERLKSGDSSSSAGRVQSLSDSPQTNEESPPLQNLRHFDQSLSLSSSSSRRRRDRRVIAATATATTIPEEQPLNLCLAPTATASGSGNLSKSSSESGASAQLCYPYDEREYGHEQSHCPLPSPSFSLSGRSERESGGENLPSGVYSPTHSVSLSPSSSSTKEYNQQNPSTSSTTGNPAKRKLQCPDCGKEFSQLRNYRYHRSRHEGTAQFACTCPICGKSFNDKGYLSSHLKIHRNAKEYQCEWCEKSFNQRVAYNMHVRIHTGHKPHKCHLCTKAFSRKMLLRQHLRTHTGERPYSCEICGKAFADRSNMLLHQRLHSGQRPYKCDICGKSFSKNHHLKTHLNHHAGIKPYQCEKCKACFSQSSNMKTHYRKCSGSMSPTNPHNSSPPSPSSLSSSSLAFTSSVIQSTSAAAVSSFMPGFTHRHHRSPSPPTYATHHHGGSVYLAESSPMSAASYPELFQVQMGSSSAHEVGASSLSSSTASLSLSAASGSTVSALPLSLAVGLVSPPLIAVSSEKLYSSRTSSLRTSVTSTASSSSSSPAATSKSSAGKSFLQLSELEASAGVLSPSLLSQSSSLLLLGASHHTHPHQSHHSQGQHHHHQQQQQHHHQQRVIHHTNRSKFSDFLSAPPEALSIQLHHPTLQSLHHSSSGIPGAPHSQYSHSHAHSREFVVPSSLPFGPHHPIPLSLMNPNHNNHPHHSLHHLHTHVSQQSPNYPTMRTTTVAAANANTIPINPRTTETFTDSHLLSLSWNENEGLKHNLKDDQFHTKNSSNPSKS